jgi:hypothetical protein
VSARSDTAQAMPAAAAAATTRLPPLERVVRAFALTSLVGGVLGLASVVFVALAHIHDTYAVDHVAGSWMALALAVNHGTLYPVLHTAHTWGGTRYMPIPFVLNAGAARLTGEYITSGKVVSFVAMAALLALLFVILRRNGLRRELAAGGIAAVVVTPLGLAATTGIHGDTLPLVLQLGALLAVSSAARRGSVVAGALCALALLAKLTAIWAAPAILVWLWFEHRRLAARFVVTYVATAVAGLALFGALSSGRLFENVFGLSFSGSGGLHALLLDAPQRIADLLSTSAASVFLLAPLALLVVALSVTRRRVALWPLALLFALAVLIVVQTDVGTSSNHLLDLCSLLVINASLLLAEADPAGLRQVAEAALGCAIAWGLFVGIAVTMAPAGKDAVKSILGRKDARYTLHPARAYLPPGATFLSEDPTVPIEEGQTPLVVDPFMLLRLGERHPAWRSALERQITAHAFDRIVLAKELDPKDAWWRESDLGAPVAAAIDRGYRLQAEVPGYWRGLWIYVPRRT